ncbi:MAG: response regulator [Bacteroidales bacterium]
MRRIVLLVAEDEVLNFMYIEALLSKAEFLIHHAKNGREAVDLFLRHKDIDLILMDLKMPEMTGFEATEAIRALNDRIPIIAQTAYSYRREECLQSGFTDYLSKPFRGQQLKDMIHTYVGGPGEPEQELL